MRRQDNKLFALGSVGRRNTLIVIGAVGALVLLYNPVRLMLSEVLYRVAPNAWVSRAAAGDVKDGFLANFRIKRSLVYENNILHEEIARMQTQVLDRNLLAEKVLKLEEALGRAGTDNRVVARVLSVPGWSLYDILAIDVGVDHGVAVGDMVVYSGAGAIGEIVEVYQTTAKVKLYSSPSEEHLVLVGETAIPGMAHGLGMGNFEVKLPKGSVISVGSPVLLLKSNLILGVIGMTEEDPTLPFVKVLFRTTFNIADIHSVEVVVSNQ